MSPSSVFIQFHPLVTSYRSKTQTIFLTLTNSSDDFSRRFSSNSDYTIPGLYGRCQEPEEISLASIKKEIRKQIGFV
jgi:hypothetical protein